MQPPPNPPTITYEELQDALAASMERERKLRAAVNRWQGLVSTAMGNIQKVTSELQVYLRDGILPD